MSKPLEDKDSPTLQAKLKELGFETSKFEPKVGNRFIVKTDGIPSYVIKRVVLPTYSQDAKAWATFLELVLYNPLGENLEKLALDFIQKGTVEIKVQLLTPTADVDTTWDIEANGSEVMFDPLDWSDDGEPNEITLKFRVINADITYGDKA